MNYEQKYKDALALARSYYSEDANAFLIDLFPELRESEDERIRKELIYFLKEEIPQCSIKEHANKLKEFVAYLEKLKERILPDSIGLYYYDGKKITYTINGFPTTEENPYDFAMSQQEEQKEQKPIDVRERPFQCIVEDKLNYIVPSWDDGEQKPVDNKAFEEWIDDWWKHNKVNNPDSYDKGNEIQFDEKGFKNFCRRIRNMYQQKPNVIEGILTKRLNENSELYKTTGDSKYAGYWTEDKNILEQINWYLRKQSLPNKAKDMIQWTGDNLKEVVNFTGKSPKFGEWFKSWNEFEEYVHSHGDIFKLFCEDGSHYEVPKGAWIVRTPDGYNVASRSKFIQKPAEWSDSIAKEMFIKALERAVEQTKKGYKLTDCDKHSWWEDFKACSRSMPIEWSEKYIADVFEKVGLAKIVREQANDTLTNAVESAMIELSKTEPAEWSEDFEENIRNLLHDKLTGHSKDGTMTWTTFIDDKTLRDIINGIWFYVGKEALKYPNKELNVAEWSEEDETFVKDAIEAVENYYSKGCGQEELVSWLKSLRPQPHWKPSEEQMAALWNAIGFIQHRIQNNSFDCKGGSINGMDYLDMLKLLTSIYEQPKAL